MATEQEKLQAIQQRMDEAAHHLRRMIELGKLAADTAAEELARRYMRDAYESAKAGLEACLGRLEEPTSAVGLTAVEGLAIATTAEGLDRKLGYVRDLMSTLRWAPVRRQDGRAVVEWSPEQRAALEAELRAVVQAAWNLIATMP
jgi:hypothetical protein